jgi:hypothetical protein
MALPALFAAPALLKAILGGNLLIGGWALSEVGRRNQKLRGADQPAALPTQQTGPGLGPLSGDTNADLEYFMGQQFGGQGDPSDPGFPNVIGGFHPGMTSLGEDFRVRGGRMAMGPGRPGIGPPVYVDGDQVHLLYGMGTEELVRLQDRMASIGLLTGTWFPGQMEDRTVSAFERLLGMANSKGQAWNAVLTSIEQDPKMADILGGGRPAFVEPTYLAPDYASIAAQVRGVFRSRLGRDPDEEELAHINAEIQGWHREGFDVEVEAARRQHEGKPGTTGERVDPMARFAEMFEGNYRGELDIVDEREDHNVARQNLDTSINTLRQMARGGF